MPTFCRHNRFFAECPICSKGTVLDPGRKAQRRPRVPASRRSAAATPAAAVARSSRGPYASAGPYDGAEVRLERVPGGLRLAAWRGGQIDRRAPVLEANDVPGLLAEAADKEVLAVAAAAEVQRAAAEEAPVEAAEPGAYGSSPGRAGELRDELRVERLADRRVRIARWIMRPNRGWELQEAPVMLPPPRFTEAVGAAARKGVLASGSPAA